MKRIVITLMLVLAFVIPATAKSKVYSVDLKQQEIQDSIKKSLDSFLNRKEYVVKVTLEASNEFETVNTGGVKVKKRVGGEALPGFELDEAGNLPKITDVFGNQFFQIKRVRVDLIMHKKLSPSEDTFIRETVPILAELDTGRGDIFNFLPIIPQEVDEEVVETMVNGKVVKTIKDPTYAGLTKDQWIYIAAGLFALLILLLVIFKIRRMGNQMREMEEGFEDELNDLTPQSVEETISRLREEKEVRLSKQEEQISEAIQHEENTRITKEVITHLVSRKDWVQRLLEDFTGNKDDVEKLTQLIHILGPHTARTIFANAMDKDHYLELEDMAAEVELTPKEERVLLRDIQKMFFAKRISEPEEIKADPFMFFDELTAAQIGFLVKDESVRIKAIAFSRLNSKDAAAVIARLPKDERGKVVVQMGKLDEMPLEQIEHVAFDLADKAKRVPDSNTVSFDGVDMLIELIGESSEAVRQELLNNLRTSDRKLSEAVEAKLFVFESIPAVPAAALTEVARKLPADDVITAIAHSSKQLQEKVILCFPDKIRRTLVSSLKGKKVTEEIVKDKQRIIIKEMQLMAEAGKVDLKQVSESYRAMLSKAG